MGVVLLFPAVSGTFAIVFDKKLVPHNCLKLFTVVPPWLCSPDVV